MGYTLESGAKTDVIPYLSWWKWGEKYCVIRLSLKAYICVMTVLGGLCKARTFLAAQWELLEAAGKLDTITFNYWRPVQCFWDFLCRNIGEREEERKEQEGEGEGEEEESSSVLSLWLNKMEYIMEWGEEGAEGRVKKAGHWLNSQTCLILDDWLASFLESVQPLLGFGGSCSPCSPLQVTWLGGACKGQGTVQGDHLSLARFCWALMGSHLTVGVSPCSSVWGPGPPWGLGASAGPVSEVAGSFSLAHVSWDRL